MYGGNPSLRGVRDDCVCRCCRGVIGLRTYGFLVELRLVGVSHGLEDGWGEGIVWSPCPGVVGFGLSFGFWSFC